MRTQKQMFYDAGHQLAERDELMLSMLFGDNPITDDELKKLIAKRPEKYSRYQGYLGKRGKVIRYIPCAGWTAELFNLYHLARTALAIGPYERLQRMQWAAKEFHNRHSAISEMRAYKELSRARDDGSYQIPWVQLLIEGKKKGASKGA